MPLVVVVLCVEVEVYLVPYYGSCLFEVERAMDRRPYPVPFDWGVKLFNPFGSRVVVLVMKL